MTFVDVAIDVPLNRTFTYSVSDRCLSLAKEGMRVVVPFGRRQRIGYITEIDSTPPKGADVKEISSFPDEGPVVSRKIMKLIKWISDYYAAPIGEVFGAAMPNLLNSVREIGRKRRMPKEIYRPDCFDVKKRVMLTSTQEEILDRLNKLIISPHANPLPPEERGKFSVALIHGVTGSGKTEIYLRLIEQIVRSDMQAILLVPEISLTPQLAGRVASCFGEKVAIYHSGLTETQRLGEWQRMKNGDAGIVVGTRSAVFAPFPRLGLIIIDEEHDHSYKQEESPRYNARDTAIMRAKFESAAVVLGSATPSLESLANTRSGKFHYFHLPERHGQIKMPRVKIVDMRKEPRSKLLNPHLSIELMAEIKRTVKQGQQALLFLNRRGFANFFLCQDCGYIPLCPNCGISLTFHKRTPRLVCHYCDFRIQVPDTCPECRSIDFFQVGSGTEMIEEIIQKEIPDARVARLDRDTATTEKKRRDILAKMHNGDIDILIGTQMITKGHDFPNVTLVGIISADQSIHFPDFRASERTFQLLTQVAGRAGRAKHPGRVIVQTYSPEHVAIKAASEGGLEGYVSSELALRKELSYPPYSRLANIRIAGNKEEQVVSTSRQIAGKLEKIQTNTTGLRLLGPAPAPLAMVRGKVRWQILLKSPSAKLLSGTLTALRRDLDDHPVSGVQVAIDVDPVSTM